VPQKWANNETLSYSKYEKVETEQYLLLASISYILAYASPVTNAL
jgi:hypothetical protein